MTRVGFPVLGDAAFHGLAGKVVRAIEPHSEADPAALLVTFLAAAGAMIGPEAFLQAGDAEHPARIWPLIIGRTAGGAKGTSLAAVRRVLHAVDPAFEDNIESGLSSGEGLIERVRDQHGQRGDKDFAEGVTDKRLLVVEPEFAAVLAKAKREGNVLSQTLRAAWDGHRLSTMTRKSSRLVSTGAHIVVTAHITEAELRAKLTESDVAGGLMNRFLPVHSTRSKLLPEGGSTPQDVVDALAAAVRDTLAAARGVREVARDSAASALWCDVYGDLARDLPDGHYASVVARATPQVARLSLIYALLDAPTGDQAITIRVEHLQAALAVWGHVDASASMIFGDLEPNRDRATLLDALTAAGAQGLTRSNIVDLFGRHKSRTALDELLNQLVREHRVEVSSLSTRGRPATYYVLRVTRDTRDKTVDDKVNALPSPSSPGSRAETRSSTGPAQAMEPSEVSAPNATVDGGADATSTPRDLVSFELGAAMGEVTVDQN